MKRQKLLLKHWNNLEEITAIINPPLLNQTITPTQWPFKNHNYKSGSCLGLQLVQL